jgi:tRNA nucleotidyltransferase (CCA-adding enzyme)
VDPPAAQELIERVRSLPAAAPLLPRLGDAAEVHLVGGAVRDLLMGDAPTDLDLVVEGDAAAFARRLGGELRVHDRFGTSTVLLDGHSYDIARARRETYARPGALPDVEPASLAEDLLRRDFTVNAIAIALGGALPGALSAVPDALEDLSARRLRVLHDQSFLDDPTRLLRLVRYAARLRFDVEAGTRELAEAAVREGALDTLSGSRIGAELRLIAREADPIAPLLTLTQWGLARAIHPGLGLEDAGLASRAMSLPADDGRRDLLALALATRGVPPAELGPWLDRLAFAASERDTILDAATRAESVASALAAAARPSDIAGAVAGGGSELVAIAGALGPEDQARQWLERLRDVRLEIDGADLLAAGIDQGPEIGRGLRSALAAKLDGLVNSRSEELEWAIRAARGR